MRKILGENFQCLFVVILLVAQVEESPQQEAHNNSSCLTRPLPLKYSTASFFTRLHKVKKPQLQHFIIGCIQEKYGGHIQNTNGFLGIYLISILRFYHAGPSKGAQ